MDNKRLQNAKNFYEGCLVLGAAGDALGRTVEFHNYNHIVRTFGEGGIRHYDKRRGVALISDDTQMTLFTANGLLLAHTAARKGETRPMEDYVLRCYREWFMAVHKQPKPEKAVAWLMDLPALYHDRASGTTCLQSLNSDAPRSLDNPINTRYGCGGVMRIAPYALMYGALLAQGKVEAFLRGAAEIGALTHGSPYSHLACQLAASIVAIILYGNGESTPASMREAIDLAIPLVRDNTPDWAEKAPFFALVADAIALAANDLPDYRNIHAIGSGFEAQTAIAIALYCVTRHEDVTEALVAAVNHSGDSDSTGAIVGNIMGAYYGFAAIPEEFRTDLEMKDVITEIADDLCLAADPSADPALFETEAWERKYTAHLD